jgi:hypothetical protein
LAASSRLVGDGESLHPVPHTSSTVAYMDIDALTKTAAGAVEKPLA